MISVLLITQKNSKFFAKWLISYLAHTRKPEDIEVLILANTEEEWNKDFFTHYNLNVFYENWNYGRVGRNLFFNYLASKAKGDWLWLMCDDHYLLDGYDEYLTEYLKKLDSNKIHCVMPRVDNSGSISHILSRGWYETVKSTGWHANIDSYINDLLGYIVYADRIHHPEKEVLHDFTTNPEIMTPEHNRITLNPLETYDINAPETKAFIEKDARLLHHAIMEGR